MKHSTFSSTVVTGKSIIGWSACETEASSTFGMIVFSLVEHANSFATVFNGTRNCTKLRHVKLHKNDGTFRISKNRFMDQTCILRLRGVIISFSCFTDKLYSIADEGKLSSYRGKSIFMLYIGPVNKKMDNNAPKRERNFLV